MPQDEKPETLYSLVSDSDSDTVAGSINSLEKKHNPSQRRQHRHTRSRSQSPQFYSSNSSSYSASEYKLTWLRWGAVIFLQTIIIILLFLRTEKPTASSSTDSMSMLDRIPAGGDINGLYVEG
jgi:hypothetical protein